MLIDRDSRAVRGAEWDESLVSALSDAPVGPGSLTTDERRAIEVLTRAGFDVRVLAAPGRPRGRPSDHPPHRPARRTARHGSGRRRRDGVRQVA